MHRITLSFEHYFGEEMDQLAMLLNEDLVSLIQHSWRASVKGGTFKINHTGIKYDGTHEISDYIDKESTWLSGIQSEYSP